MANATEQEQAARMTEDAAKSRQFPKPTGSDPVGSIPLSKQDLPHHAGVDPSVPDDRDRPETGEESAETS